MARQTRSSSRKVKLPALTLVWRDKPLTTNNWSVAGVTFSRLPFKRLTLGEQEDVQLQFSIDGMDVRFPALIEITRINHRRREVGCRFLMIDPRGERVMHQLLETHGFGVDEPVSTHESSAPDTSDDVKDFGQTNLQPETVDDEVLEPGKASHVSSGPVAHSQLGRYDHSREMAYERDEEEQFVNPLQLIYRALRGRWQYAALTFAIVAALFASLGYLLVQPIYQSRGLVRISAKEPKILYADSDDSRLRLFDAFVSSELTYLTSRPVLDRAIYLLNSQGAVFEDSPETVADLSVRLNARKIKSMIELTADATDAESSKAMVNAVLDGYQQLHVEQLDQRQTIRERELIAREQELLTRIDQLKSNLLAVGGEYSLDSLRQTHQTKLQQIQELDDRLAEMATDISQRENGEQVANTTEIDVAIQRSIMLDRALADLTFERTKRAATLSTLRERYAAKHPAVRHAEDELKIVDNAIVERHQLIRKLAQTGTLEGGSAQNVEEMKASLSTQTNRLEKMRADAEALNAKLLEVSTVSDDLTEHNAMLQETRRVLEQVRVESRNSLPGSVEVLSRGSLPERPAINRRNSAVMLSLVAALGITIAGFAGYSVAQPRARYSDELADVDGLEMLGVIQGLGKVEGFATPVISQIRAELEIGTPQLRGMGRAFVVSAIDQMPDTALFSIQLANSFSSVGINTLVIDGDPSSSELTDQSRKLADQNRSVLEGKAKSNELFSFPVMVGNNLALIPGSGALGIHHATMSAEATQHMIQSNRGHHDCVLYQGGKLTDDVICRFVAAEVDGIILVINRHQKLEEIQREVDVARRLTGGRVFGVFINAAANDPGLRYGAGSSTTIQSLKMEAA